MIECLEYYAPNVYDFFWYLKITVGFVTYTTYEVNLNPSIMIAQLIFWLPLKMVRHGMNIPVECIGLLLVFGVYVKVKKEKM